MSTADLESIVQQVLAGNREAYRQVVEACEASVRLTLGAIVPEAGAVEDLAQETFLTAYSKLKEYRPDSDFRAFLKGIARNLAFNERRRWMRHTASQRRYRVLIESSLEPADEPKVSDEIISTLRQCTAHLAPTARQLVEAHYYAGHSSLEVAQQHGRDVNWVRVTLCRARTSLLECLRRKGVALHEC